MHPHVAVVQHHPERLGPRHEAARCTCPRARSGWSLRLPPHLSPPPGGGNSRGRAGGRDDRRRNQVPGPRPVLCYMERAFGASAPPALPHRPTITLFSPPLLETPPGRGESEAVRKLSKAEPKARGGAPARAGGGHAAGPPRATRPPRPPDLRPEPRADPPRPDTPRARGGGASPAARAREGGRETGAAAAAGGGGARGPVGPAGVVALASHGAAAWGGTSTPTWGWAKALRTPN